MRSPSLVLLTLTLASALSACSGDSSSSPVSPGADAGGDSDALEDASSAETGLDASSDASNTLGTVTLRFKNTGTTTVYVDVTYGGGPLAITSSSHPEAYTLGTQCAQACPCSDMCAQCGAPQPAVKVVSAGEHFDMIWTGAYHTFQSCADSFCQCYESHFVLPGIFDAGLTAALGVTGGTPDTADPTILRNAELDTTKGTCSAKSSFELSSSPGTVEIPFVCSSL